MNATQKEDMATIFNGVKGAGVLDYVTAWYLKAAQYMQQANTVTLSLSKGFATKAAFVSTNSISQGEQVGILWNELFNKYKIKIHFAHRTFSWSNEARGNAAVHVVIIGFANFDADDKTVYEYEHIKGEPHELKVKNINPYLVEGKDSFINKRRKPINQVPEISFGSMPNDGGYFLLDDEERKKLINFEPRASKYIKPLISAHEFLNGENRWCIWLKNAAPNDLKSLKEISQRINAVKLLREKSTRDATKRLAQFPTLFGEIRQPNTDYILIPRHSSENRNYIPFGYLTPNNIVSDSCSCISNVTYFHLGIVMSRMHMVWIKTTCGRIKSDFRYSNELVYNNYPWPENPTSKQKEAVEKAAQVVLDARTQFLGASLADLYDPNTMPPVLVKAHQVLDKEVDLCYRSQPFTSETKRIEFLFELYDKYISGMFVKEKKKK